MVETEQLRWVRLTFVDVFGGVHAVVLPGARFDTAVERGAPFDGSALEGRARHLEADMLLKPDPSTMVRLDGGQARVACTVIGPDGHPWPGDPRTALVSLIGRVGQVARSWRAAAELEFYLLDPDGAPVDHGDYFGELEGEGMALAKTAAERLAGYGVDVISAHLEAGPGQYELDLASMAPLALADALVLAKQVLKEEAAMAGLRVTFMARPFAGQPGSGLHLHQHVEGGLFDDHGWLDADGRSFVGGLLAHAAGLAPLAAPNINSYKRLHSGPEAPSDVMWGHHNRGALVRVGLSGERRPAVEFRLADPAANPYLLIIGLLAATADGLESGLDPGTSFEEDPGGFDPAAMSTVQVHSLPRDLDSALDALLLDDVLVDAFDNRLLSRLIDGRRAEVESYRTQITPWEVERYLDDA